MIFIFTQNEVPKAITDLLDHANTSEESIDFFILHQANRFILSKIANKMNIKESKMFNNVCEKFGNLSSVSIPAAICFNIGQKLKEDYYKLCLSGFGVGLTWGALLIDVGKLRFADLIEMP